ncbi:MAG: choice-of-anchor Q domain-containing protein [Dokdonella sp.]|uniref:choice-of-anchor Q domain-containing protein n=1 Tax=Dokdonella sp. TaxID=2291710 RepID=UPI003F7EBAF1
MQYRVGKARGRRWSLLAPMMALLGAMPAAPAMAAVFCVDSEASAQAALDTARTNGQADAVRFVAGVYPLTSGLDYATGQSGSDHKALVVSGGFNAACTARTGTTFLDGQEQVQPLRLSFTGADVVSVDHLSLFRGMTEAGSYYGGNMQVYMFDQAGGAKLTIDAVRFLLGGAEANTGGLYVTGWGSVVVTNSLFAGNASGYSPAASINLTGALHFTGNTVTANSVEAVDASPAMYLHAQGGSHFWLSNNIIWGNDNASQDLSLLSGGIYDLVSNDIGSYSGAPGAGSGGNVSVDPQFAACGLLCFDKPLKRSSPLVDAGSDAPPGGLTATDALGVPRVIGVHVDVGAYELDRLFADGFQSAAFPF